MFHRRKTRALLVRTVWTPLVVVGACLVPATSATASPGATTGFPPILRNAVPELPSGCGQHPTTVPTVPAASISAVEKRVETFVGRRHFDGIGTCEPGVLLLMLTPGSEAVAARVRATFGPEVQIEVGLTSWDGRPGRSPLCGSLAPESPVPPYISLALHLRRTRVAAGNEFSGSVVVEDAGPGPLLVATSQPLLVALTKPHSQRIVGIYFGGVAGTGLGLQLEPGQSSKIPALGGTARCDGALGSVLPPGTYDAVAEVTGVGISGTGAAPPPTYYTPKVTISVT